MAGSNPQLAIRIAANTDELKRNLAEGRAAIEALGPSVAKMSAQWQANAARVIQNANNITAALQGVNIGTLSAADASKNLRALDQALAQLKASGAPIPPLMQQTADQLRQVGATASAAATEIEKAPTAMGRMEAKAIALGTAAGAFLGQMAWGAVNKLGQEVGVFVERGTQLGALQSSFQKLASGIGQSGNAMLGSMQRASRGMVSEFDLMKAANKAMLLGLPVTEASMGTLTEAATRLGRAMGMDATKSVDDLITALGRSSPMILDNLGLTVKVGEANYIYAAKLGKTAEQLTDAEKKTAFYEEAMRKAREKSDELGQSTKTLGEMLQTAWVSIGDVVTRVVSDYNVGIGAALSSTRNFAQFLSMAMTQGIGPAVALFAEMERVKNATVSLDAASQLAAKALLKQGETVQQIAQYLNISEKSVQAFVDSLKKGNTQGDQFTDTGKKVGVTWSGSFEDIFNYSKIVQAELDAMSKISWSGTTLELQKFNQALMDTVGISWSGSIDGIRQFNQALMDAFVGESWSGVEADLANLGKILGDAGTTGGQAFLANTQAALANLGSVIVGAIQGGGDVSKAAFASIGGALGADLGASITKSLTGVLGKGLAGAIGGMLGPLGALLGSGLGSLFGGLFKNQGRDDAKAFAASFGGFDALQAKMLTLGPAYDKLWRDLTQNTKGPAQVAAAIKAIEDAFKAQEDAAAKAGAASASAFAGPAGAAGFPTKAQLQQAAADAEEAYRYIRDSGLYTAATVDEAFQRWQDSLAAAGNTGAAALKKIDAEMKSLQDSIAMEAPEEVMGVIEAEQRARLAALEEEKKAALVSIEEQTRAEEAAAATAEDSAQKAFDDTKARAKALDDEMRRIFSQGYDIPFRFTGMPGGGSGSSAPGYAGGFANGGTVYTDRPTFAMFGEAGPERATFTPMRGGNTGGMGGDQTIVVQVDGDTLVRHTVRGMPRYLKLRGA